MSLPPELIRVKRKATEIEPVSYLRVQEHKRHVTDAFVYQRQKQEATFADIPTPIQRRPIIHTSESKRDDSTFQSTKDNKNSHVGQRGNSQEPPVAPTSSAESPVGASADEPRRFHMSRAEIMLAASNYPAHRSLRGISKKRSAPALFVERKHKRIPSTKFQSIAHGLGAHTPEQEPHAPPLPVPAEQSEEMEVDTVGPKQHKKPGLVRQTQKQDTSKKELPSSMTNRWNVNLDQLTADMNAFAMEQIGLNLQRQEEEERKRKERAAAPRTHLAAVPSSPSRFKPKAPPQRYAERHPKETRAVSVKDMLEPDAGASDTDDEGYVIETYVRVPASTMNTKSVKPADVGVLVFDEEPDMEYFYGVNDDSDDDFAEDEDDENAENYYAADYPDDEVASDDEFGHNAYAYRNGNASDMEEYDVNDYQDDNPDDGSNTKDGFKSIVGRDGQMRKHL
ncbi:hypothetical protein BKA67DRAFT_658445 [Truncatella angustata]|uniref:Transcription factor Iwr1 domain-containing protein n=1 Tax=Truncatella angustata TaxID=152316 RepID=A0A9P8ZWU7_9PEZI|nr:uncharacterized protein BKA67DRAFT_658445 [Truncatella angustata]KAH6654122.1 hypothetical protein BKA67DRAFT_658445 [Truncatella angustata]